MMHVDKVGRKEVGGSETEEEERGTQRGGQTATPGLMQSGQETRRGKQKKTGGVKSKLDSPHWDMGVVLEGENWGKRIWWQ